MNPRQNLSHSIHSQPPLLRTGIPSFDEILKGGIAPGSLCLVEESSHNSFSEIFSKCYLGEGAVSNDFLFTYSETLENTYIPNVRRIGNSDLHEENLIRYETFAANSNVREPYAIDLKSSTSEYKNWIQRFLNCSEDDFYHKLWTSIKNDIQDSCSFNTSKRIFIQSMFSANWPQRSLSEVFEFLKCIKTLLRSKNAVCVISVPLSSIDEKLRTLINKACDFIILASTDKGLTIRIYKAPKPLNINANFVYSITEAQGTMLVKQVLI